MLPLFLNSPIHQSIHWLNICNVLSHEAWNRVQKRPCNKPSTCTWPEGEEWACRQPHSLDPTSPIRGGSTENGRKRKPPPKHNKTRCHRVRPAPAIYWVRCKGNPCLILTGPLEQREKNKCGHKGYNPRCAFATRYRRGGENVFSPGGEGSTERGHQCSPFSQVGHPLSLSEDQEGCKNSLHNICEWAEPLHHVQSRLGWQRRERGNGSPCCYPLKVILKVWITLKMESLHLRVKGWGHSIKTVH